MELQLQGEFKFRISWYFGHTVFCCSTLYFIQSKKKIKSKREKLRVVVLEPNKSSESSQNAKVKTVSVLMEVLVSNRFCYF